MPSEAFYATFKSTVGQRAYAIANEVGTTPRHAERLAVAKHILQDWDGAVQQLLSVYLSNFVGAAEDAGTVGTNLDAVIDTMARAGAWGP
jgi:hypothetical protein